jgi:hypothetical protein
MMFVMMLIAATSTPIPAIIDEFLRHNLLDYDSAKIEVIRESYHQEEKVDKERFDTIVHCYRVNGKNGFGGYVGFRKYLMIERDAKIWYFNLSPDRGETRSVVEKYCGELPPS